MCTDAMTQNELAGFGCEIEEGEMGFRWVTDEYVSEFLPVYESALLAATIHLLTTEEISRCDDCGTLFRSADTDSCPSCKGGQFTELELPEWDTVRRAFGLDGSFRYTEEAIQYYLRLYLETENKGPAAGWQPIATAPFDTLVLVRGPSGRHTYKTTYVSAVRVVRGTRHVSVWLDVYGTELTEQGITPTEWMPLP